MKCKIWFTIFSVFLLLITPLYGQTSQEQEATDEEPTAHIDVDTSVWFSDITEESSKAEEYGEIPEGFLVSRFRVDLSMKDDRFLNMTGKNVGLNTAAYAFDYGQSGNYTLSIDYSKIPHLFSRDGLTIWSETAPGQWSLADNLQQTIQDLNSVDPTDPTYSAGLLSQRQYVSGLLSGSHPQELRLQRNFGNIGFVMTPGSNWKYGLNYFMENRDGYRPFGTAFGFSWVTELPEHIDYNTENIRAEAVYNSNGKTLSFSYDLSLFNNEINEMVWDNPLRITDRTFSTAYTNGDGTSRGRAQLAPDNAANTIKVGGAAKVGKGRVTGSFSFGLWTDEVELLPFTINTAIEPIPLPSSTFNGKQQVINANLRYTLPVGTKGDFSANYRLYDNNNKNDQFNIGEYVRLDQVEEELVRYECNQETNTCTPIMNPPTHLFAFASNTLDLTYGFRFTKNLKWHAMYSYDRWSRETRDVETTNTNRFLTGIDYLGADWFTLRATYQYAHRTSDHFEVSEPVYLPLPLRRYDVANLNQNVFRVLADFIPGESTVLGVNMAVSDNEYPDSLYGLMSWNDWSIGADFSYAFKNSSTLNFWYEHGNTERDQGGRQSNSDGTPATSPARDWFVNLLDKYDTFGAGYSMLFHEGKAQWNTNGTWSKANGSADFQAGPALRPTGTAGIPNVDDTDLYTIRTGIDVKIFARARIGLSYWYEKYTIDDFAENAITQNLIFIPVPGQPTPATGGTITLNEIQPDYEFHSAWLGFLYSW